MDVTGCGHRGESPPPGGRVLQPPTLVHRGKSSQHLPGRDGCSGLPLWGRLILATHWVVLPGETVAAVALKRGCRTPGTLQKALEEHVGTGPTSIQRNGGLP